jgi:hypothetical protein
MHQNNWTIFALKLIFACLAIGTITAVLVGTEAQISNGLALTDADYMMAVGAEDRAPTSRIVVEAR